MLDFRTTRLLSWEGNLPQCGEYLRTESGTVYAILSVRPNVNPNPKSVAKLDLLKLRPEDVVKLPDDAAIHFFKWASRTKKT